MGISVNASMNISNEIGMIAEKVVKEWLETNGYAYIDCAFTLFEDWKELSLFRSIWSFASGNIARKHLKKTEQFYGKDLARVKDFFDQVLKLPYDSEKHHSNFFPDLIARMPELTFIEVKANQSKVEPFQQNFLRLAREHGFKTKIARVYITLDKRLEWH